MPDRSALTGAPEAETLARVLESDRGEDRLKSLAALFRNRDAILATLRTQGIRAPSLACHTDERHVYVLLDDDDGKVASVASLLRSFGVEPELARGGLLLPTPDMRWKRSAVVAARIVDAFHRFFEPFQKTSFDPVPEREWARIAASLPYRNIGVDGLTITVDGYRSRATRVIVDAALDTLFRSGTAAEIERLLEVLAQPLASPVPPQAAAIRAELDALLAKLVRPRTLVSFRAAEPSALDSHLYGPAYIEADESWPRDEDGELDLVLQLVRGGPLALPDGVALLQVFVGAEIPWDLACPSLRIKTYATLRTEQQIAVPAKRSVSYAIDTSADGSLPDFHSLAQRGEQLRVRELCEQLDDLVPSDAYEAARARFVRDPSTWTFAGGHARWVSDRGSESARHEPVIQMGSMPEPDLQWGAGNGVAYLFWEDGKPDWYLDGA